MNGEKLKAREERESFPSCCISKAVIMKQIPDVPFSLFNLFLTFQPPA
jgi:hypothetical protein